MCRDLKADSQLPGVSLVYHDPAIGATDVPVCDLALVQKTSEVGFVFDEALSM